jgi:GH15 family glucan-1,4-alpha-glucosidase
MCWVALDRVSALQAMGRVPRHDEQRFKRERDAIRAAIESRGFDATVGSYVAAFDAVGEADAALLQMARLGFHEPSDPRLVGTEMHVRRCLGHRHALIDRYRTKGQDALPPGEGAFVACAFWAVEARARRGDREGAVSDFEKLLKLANDVGLYSEEIAPDTGEMLGNFPQAFTHLALINAALALQDPSAGSRAQDATDDTSGTLA